MRLDMDLSLNYDGNGVIRRIADEEHPLDYRAKYFKESMQAEDTIYRPYSPQIGMTRSRSPYHVSSTTSTPTSTPPPSLSSNHQMPAINRMSPLTFGQAINGQHLQYGNGLQSSFNHQAVPVTSAAASGAPNTLVLPIMRSSRRKCMPIPAEAKDDSYWEKRRRNNQSAKRSRELKRIKGIETYARVMFLEQENVMLRTQVQTLKEEIDKLREMVFQDRNGGHKYTCYHNNNGNNES